MIDKATKLARRIRAGRAGFWPAATLPAKSYAISSCIIDPFEYQDVPETETSQTDVNGVGESNSSTGDSNKFCVEIYSNSKLPEAIVASLSVTGRQIDYSNGSRYLNLFSTIWYQCQADAEARLVSALQRAGWSQVEQWQLECNSFRMCETDTAADMKNVTTAVTAATTNNQFIHFYCYSNGQFAGWPSMLEGFRCNNMVAAISPAKTDFTVPLQQAEAARQYLLEHGWIELN